MQILQGVTRNQPLIPVSTLITHRSVLRLIDGAGRPLAEVDDDLVEAFEAGDSVPATRWHEVEVELVEGREALLPAVSKRLRRSGATPATSSSKLSRALPDSLLEPARGRGRPAAGDVLAEYIAEQHRVILSGDVSIRRGNQGAVHKTRVASRRLRSTLRTFAPMFDAVQATRLDEELRWYAGVLGEVRDAQVLYRRLTGMIAELDDSIRLGPVQARVDVLLRGQIAKSWQALSEELTGERYLDLLEALAFWDRRPPLTAKASRGAASLERYIDRADRKVARRLGRANRTGDVEALHASPEGSQTGPLCSGSNACHVREKGREQAGQAVPQASGSPRGASGQPDQLRSHTSRRRPGRHHRRRERICVRRSVRARTTASQCCA